jgi:hypothetical protein
MMSGGNLYRLILGIIACGVVFAALSSLVRSRIGGSSASTPTPTPPTQVIEYLRTLQQETADLKTAFQLLNFNPSMSDVAVVSILNDAAGRTQRVTDEAHTLDPPACLAEYHRRYLAFVDLENQGMHDAYWGMQVMDIPRATRGRDEMDKAVAEGNGLEQPPISRCGG